MGALELFVSGVQLKQRLVVMTAPVIEALIKAVITVIRMLNIYNCGC